MGHSGNLTRSVRLSGRLVQLMNGEISVEDLDDEELARGQVKDEHGKFPSGPMNAVIPREMHDELVRRVMKRGDEQWRSAYLPAIRTFTTIAQNPAVEPATRLRAAQYIIERLAGKIPDKVELQAEVKPWENVVSGILVSGEEEKRVIQGEVIE